MPRSGPGPVILRPSSSTSPAVRPLEAGDQRHQRGLALAGITDDDHELALFNGQIDVRSTQCAP
jgi:hypothetical protein